jgi:hypothetical protein
MSRQVILFVFLLSVGFATEEFHSNEQLDVEFL